MTISVAIIDQGAGLRAAVLYGQPARIGPDELAGYAQFGDAALVLYQLRTQRLQTFLFRGLGAVSVPGVTPTVNLIAHATNATQSRKLVRTVLWLAEHGFAPAQLPDALWLRIAALLNREKYGVRQLRRLLDAQA
ncbi:MAG: hypothetical protein GY802_07695 [Gammaproteobacteria bacterium]|nr:hypothetical protein [Gammaproteobacteria bacterium]MCP4388162.1 hypothetical protein [Gammaproteobacteria bacterium]MCP5090303.1 hypothetical protein [Gammaproteobacteria bacterium]